MKELKYLAELGYVVSLSTPREGAWTMVLSPRSDKRTPIFVTGKTITAVIALGIERARAELGLGEYV